MHFVNVETIPQNHSDRSREVEKLLQDFMDSGMFKAKIVLDDAETMPPINVFRRFTRGNNAYPVFVQERDYGVYLMRRFL